MENRRSRVLVVGAGIAGLATAVALHQRGLDVEVIERARALDEIGAALSLWPNALAALGELGLEAAVLEEGTPVASGTLRAPSGRVITAIDEGALRRALQGPTIAIHRAVLQRLLLEAASGIPLRLGSPCVDMEIDGNRVAVHLADGSRVEADALVGCDGVQSVVRAALFGREPLRYAGYTTWRTVVAAGWLTESWLSIGRGKQFIASPISGGRAYWAAAACLPEGANRHMPAVLPFLMDAFAAWHAPIADLMQLSSEENLIRTDIYDRPPPARLGLGPVALGGDAAHPMTPDLGQGACQALEDAVVIGACLENHEDPSAAFARYQAARVNRVGRIVRDSWRLGRLFGTQNPPMSAARNVALRLAPASFRLREMATYGSREAFYRSLAMARRSVRSPDAQG
jgi:2-polyprenyl-6-methoxyphenol hydroxylase-like FAD-dependent oxidoreductase